VTLTPAPAPTTTSHAPAPATARARGVRPRACAHTTRPLSRLRPPVPRCPSASIGAATMRVRAPGSTPVPPIPDLSRATVHARASRSCVR
jgi:hypothetical protein